MNNLRESQEEMKKRMLNQYEGKNPINEYLERKIKTIKFNNEQLKRYLNPIVYIYWKYEQNYKFAYYVGQSSQGMARPLAKNHYQKVNCLLADELEIFPCYDEQDATLQEWLFIRYLRPKFNQKLRKEWEPRIIYK